VELFNTFSETMENFAPLADPVTIYVCGITPYDTTHLGHAFTYTSVDILIRYLESKGFRIRYVQNVTDIDDDILRRAKEVEEDWQHLGNRWTRHYIQDMQSLNVRPPDYFPRASAVIPEIITWVERLLSADVAYESGGSVYFDIDSWDNFGDLCKIPREEMLPIANERGNHPDDPYKRHPLDFVLWQAQSPGEPAWDSPWGLGRPGWHIECSTLSTKFLGESIDIHSGGADLCFPHHECEIAQVAPVTGMVPFVRIWMHTAMVYYQGEKMSKSLGNLIWVRDLLKVYSPDALRLYMGSHHYREEWSHDEAELKIAEEHAKLILKALAAQSGGSTKLDASGAIEEFSGAMDSDLDTSTALGVMLSLAEKILAEAENGGAVGVAQEALKGMTSIFGMQFGDGVENRVKQGWGEYLPEYQ
jgi:L-cysteine:1D-myo-inositol 2-amino-2-deoxy-alpha-D-glucopyranoside ligase